MTIIRFIRLSIILITFACSKKSEQKVKHIGFEINPLISVDAKKRIHPLKKGIYVSELDSGYLSYIDLDIYINDSLQYSNNFDGLFFRSNYSWIQDTLFISGHYGSVTQNGFLIKIANNQASLFHSVVSDSTPLYCSTKDDKLESKLLVPSTIENITISNFPDSSSNQIIFGYVDFKSSDYYSIQGHTTEEIPQRDKITMSMKIYFKSHFLE